MPNAFAVHRIFAVWCVGPLSCIFLCRAASSVVSVNHIFVMRSCLSLPWPRSLPCVFLRAHGKEIFVVRGHTAKIACTAAPVFPVVYIAHEDGHENAEMASP
jgi:hypothetical protein